jgi:hypothetical protein
MRKSAPAELVEQLSRNSTPYHDPVAKVRWDTLDRDAYWLPPEAVSLHGVPEFMALPESQRKRLSQYEFLNFVEAGIWLEGIFMERIARSLRGQADRVDLKYRLHELREEAGHTLMFLELMERSGLPLPANRNRGHLLADLFGRHAPLESLAFWMAMVIGEEVPDRLNRYVRKHASQVCPAITEICTLHIIDEARHIAYARGLLEERLDGLRGWQRPILKVVMGPLLRQFVSVFYYPTSHLYDLAGLMPGRTWAKRARTNPHRTRFVAQCLNPALQLLRERDLNIAWH